jgi:hypothetical protein
MAMSENPSPIEPVKPESMPKPMPNKGLSERNKAIVIAAIAVVAVLVLAVAASLLASPKDHEGVLLLTINPDPATVDAGQTMDLVANATWDGDSIDASPNAQFKWSLGDSLLGSLTTTTERLTEFLAGDVGGVGQILCVLSFIQSGKQMNASASVTLTVNPPTLASVSVAPSQRTLLYDRVQVLNATAVDSVGDPVIGLNYTWTVEGIPSANYSINSTWGASINFTANATGTAWVNATATYNGVTKVGGAVLPVMAAAPTTILSRSNLPGGAGKNFTCSEPTLDLHWNEITVYLTDGTVTVNWSLSMAGLNSGSLNMSEFGPRNVGTLVVFLNVTDMAGNGSVSADDFFTFTTSNGRFNPARNYVVTLEYKPTLDLIAQMTFVG